MNAPGTTRIEVRQEKVRSADDERTEIVIETCDDQIKTNAENAAPPQRPMTDEEKRATDDFFTQQFK